MGQHNIVIARPVTTGRTDTAAAAVNMIRTFSKIRFGLVVGIAGGATTSVGRRGNEKDILLGDVVVSRPHGNHGGILQYDKGTMYPEGFRIRSHLNGPPPVLIQAAGKLQSIHNRRLEKMQDYIYEALSRLDSDDFSFPGRDHDLLFETLYHHAPGGRLNCCDGCDKKHLVEGRETRITPAVHYGLVASADALLRNGEMRDKMRESEEVLCVEMEAAGLANRFPCIAICGISDYADTHKNMLWQPYAALTAGAYAKELLAVMEPAVVEGSDLASNQLKETMNRLETILDVALLDRLSTLSPPTKPPTLIPMGQWILESEEFKYWVDGGRWQLRLCGEAGTGKTPLSTIIASHLQKTFPSFPVVYISLSDEQSEVQKPAKILGSFIRQLIQFDAAATIPEKLKNADISRALGSEQTLKEIFEELLLKYDRTYLIVDGLNLCSEDVKKVVKTYPMKLLRKGLPISLLTTSLGYREMHVVVRCDECDRSNLNIYFRCLCNDERYDICLQCKNDGECSADHEPVEHYDTVRLEVRASQDELERYCSSRLMPPPRDEVRDEDVHPHPKYEQSTVVEYLRNRPNLADAIAQDIAAKAQGKIILAEAWTGALLDLRKVPKDGQQLFLVLDTVPSDYLKRYCKNRLNLAKKNDGKEYQVALRTFAFIIAACRPLTLLELQHALALESDTGTIEKSNLDLRTYILRATNGLITIDKGDVEYSFVRFFHDSIATALVGSGLDACLNAPSAFMAAVCLKYLQDTEQFSEHYASIEEYPFLAYALEHWGDHVRNAALEHDPNAKKEICQLLRNTEITRAMACVYSKKGINLDHQGTSVLHLCAWFGLSDLLQTFHGKDHDINATEPRKGYSPLRLACRKGHTNTVCEIIKLGGRIDNRVLVDTICGVPGIISVNQEQESRVDILKQLLLETGNIEINAQFGERKCTGLMIAVKHGYHQVAVCLLDYPTLALDAEDVHGHTALWYAVYYYQRRDRPTLDTDQRSTNHNTDWLRLIKLLVQRGSNPNRRDRNGRTILSLAVAVGDLTVVEILVKCHTYPLEWDKDLLHVASAAGKPAIIRLLYSTKLAKTGIPPDINARDHHGLTPLHYAGLTESDEARSAAATLRDLNADLNHLDSRGCTPYTLAVLLGHESVASVLSDKYDDSVNRNSNIKSLTDLPALFLARAGHWEVLKGLITSSRPDVMHRDILSGNNLVHLATAANHI
ncbi:hypothetical protein BDV06DRAFT_218557 [Aspergillus oleicola]